MNHEIRSFVNLEAAAIPAHKAVLSSYKLISKGMMQIFVGQDVPVDVLRSVFTGTLSR